MANSWVSVIIPAYNRGNLIVGTLESVWCQQYRPIELILVDDGSTDDTVARVQAWASAKGGSSQGFRFMLLQQSNSGAPAARNRGLAASTGSYVQFLDSDDLLSEDKLQKQVAVLDAADASVAAFCETLFFQPGQKPKDGALQQGRRIGASADPVAWLTKLLGWDGRGGMIAPHAWLVPRSVAQEVGPWRECLTTNQDGEYFARIVLGSSTILKTEGYAYYRVNQGGTTQSARITRADFRSLLNSFLLIEEHLMEIAQKDQVCRVKASVARHFMEIAYQSYPSYPGISALAQRLARERKEGIAPPIPQASTRSALLHRLVGWKGARILSKLYHG